MKQTKRALRLLLGLFMLAPAWLQAQPTSPPPPPSALTLEQCLQYALQNQPVLRQARLDEETNEATIRIGLAGWLPQVGLNATGQHYFQLPYTVFPNAEGVNVPRQIGLRNTSTVGLAATQALYNNDVRLALRTARPSRQFYQQNTVGVRIDVVTDVSKAFYDVLLSQRQLDVLGEDIVRLQRSLKDARARYEAGIVDKTDYKQAEILLNNSVAARKQAQEAIKAKSAYLRELMGLSGQQPLTLQYDTLRLMQDAAVDTAVALDPANRIELQQLQTQKALQAAQISYYRWGFLPSLSAFGNYNAAFLSNEISTLYNQRLPNSYAGLQLSLPIFQGLRRLQNLRRERLTDQRLDQDILATRNRINTEFEQALASYKGYYADYLIGQRNLALSKEVYSVVDLQYREGIKTYLDVIVAQTTLRTAQLNYYSALFQVLSSKVDLLRAQGNLPTGF
ncbi:outer membrane protein TolC [Hymenobacter luteus]|uniref:Outer membrane protein TolC n=2 Tax=Hymenobacter TaxID=89966 RepID=A0A7W9T462_9BACT|nr:MULTISPECIES: TolC family protein [Hymenobacter]MBB4602573.1 outer membrane protein TolC [Hymenobacter latericoloratus]MBB6060464.1 outer membrane protein TolC [Hymenobacter luteus]